VSCTAEQLLTVARSQIGYLEGPRNWTKYGRDYGMNNEAWCQTFLWWCFSQAGGGSEMPKNACTRVVYPWYRRHRTIVSLADARPGDVVWFDFSSKLKPVSHVGIVEKVVHGHLQTIEGNTTRNGAGGREGVYRRTRGKHIVAIGRPHYASAPPSVAKPGKDVHVVRAGDTLSKIAAGWGLSLDALLKANPKAGHPAGHHDVIWPGDKIVHP
jgi:LysM repeat protein